MERVIEAIRKADEEWLKSLPTRDVERIISFWTDDAVVYAPAQVPVRGKAAIREYVASSFNIPGFSLTWETLEVVPAASGDLAYAHGTNSVTFADPEGKTVTESGRGITVWRKDADGRWRCAVDIWNSGPPAAG